MTDIILQPIDETYIRVNCEAGIAMELGEHFTFMVPGARHMPKFKLGMWDGKIRLYNTLSRTLYKGLTHEVKKFAADRGYEVVDNLDTHKTFTEDQFRAFIKGINPKFEVRDYQFKAFSQAINDRRGLLVSPTASGKSFIIYLVARFMNLVMKKNVLIIVPNTSLVEQMQSDFIEYNNDVPFEMHGIYDGAEKKIAPIVVSTWQSIYKEKKPFFANFPCIIGDEVHTFSAKSLKSIMENAEQTPYRVGLTGTLDGSLTNELVLSGLFGPVTEVTTYERLLEDEHIVKPNVKIILLSYSDEERKLLNKAEYKDEIAFLVKHQERNRQIKLLTSSLKGNTLILFNRVETHGKPLAKMLKEALPERNHYMIYGGVDTDDREKIRHILETEDDAICCCSYQTFGTGINVKKIHHIAMVSPTKSKVRLLQAIGRGLRLHESKTILNVWDLADDLKYKSKRNHGMVHLEERIKIYNEKGFDYKIYKKEIK